MRLTAVAAPGVLAGSVTADEVFAAALAARDLTGELVRPSTPEQFAAALRSAAGEGEEFLVLPADATAVDGLLARAGLDPGVVQVVRVDVDAREPDASVSVRRHVRGRGMEGLRFGVEDWFFARTSPGTRHAYGEHADQYAQLRLPDGEGPFPVAVLVHGGYWRSRWENDLMSAMAVDLTAGGFATWNVEYRRPDRHGWNATTADVAAALQALATVRAPLDLDRVVTLGHSAGGQLVVRLAADQAQASAGIRPVLTVSLAGCLDLHSIAARALSEAAVAAALGGTPQEVPQVYAAASPLQRLPIGLPVAVVCCTGDDPDLLDASRRFAAAAQVAGDTVEVVEAAGDHFCVITPGTPVWQRTTALVRARVQH